MMRLDYSVYLVAQTDAAPPERLLETVAAAVQGGATLVQLREKNAATGVFVAIALKLKTLLDAHNIPLLINDRLDVALACGAHGVHLGQDDMPLALARQILGPDKVIGISAANVAEALAAQRGGADYLGVGAIYATPTKADAGAPLGPEGLKAITARVDLPVVAIGGMKAHNTALMRQNGARGVAVVSGIMAAADPARAAREIKQAWAAGGDNNRHR